MPFISLLFYCAKCITVTFKTKLKSFEIGIDGGAVMELVVLLFVMVQLGFPTGIREVRSQMAA